MSLAGTFYSIDKFSFEENTILSSLTLNADHAIFKGHFPGNPVTPGVVQMEITKELVRKALEKEVQLLSMSNCKFLAILNPSESPSIQVELAIGNNEDGSIKVSGSMKNDTTTFIKIAAVYN